MPSLSLQKRFGRVVARLRKEAGHSQEEFAAKVGVHRSYMGAIERGERSVGFKTLEKVARALGVRSGDLLNEAEKL